MTGRMSPMRPHARPLQLLPGPSHRHAVRLLRRLAVSASLVVATVLLPAAASAQTGVTVGGVVYARYQYLINDTAAHVNQFDITRSYINVIGRFDGGIQTRVTGDIYRVADNSLAFRLKYAHFAWTPKNSPLTYKFGLMQTS